MKYPKYISHKEVSAVKIAEVDPGADGSVTLKLEGGFDNVILSHEERRHKPVPVAGSYLVQYADGHVSFSPALAFEAGYTLVGPAEEALAGVDLGKGTSQTVIQSDDDGEDDAGPVSPMADLTMDDDEDDEDDEEDPAPAAEQAVEHQPETANA